MGDVERVEGHRARGGGRRSGTRRRRDRRGACGLPSGELDRELVAGDHDQLHDAEDQDRDER